MWVGKIKAKIASMEPRSIIQLTLLFLVILILFFKMIGKMSDAGVFDSLKAKPKVEIAIEG